MPCTIGIREVLVVFLAHAGAGVVGIASCQGRAKHAEFWRAYSRSKRRRAKPLFRVLSTNVHTSHFQALMCILRPQNQLCLRLVCARFIEKGISYKKREESDPLGKGQLLFDMIGWSMIINPGDKLKGFIFWFVLICSSSSAQYVLDLFMLPSTPSFAR